MFSKKVTKIWQKCPSLFEIHKVKSAGRFCQIFVAFLENMNSILVLKGQYIFWFFYYFWGLGLEPPLNLYRKYADADYLRKIAWSFCKAKVFIKDLSRQSKLYFGIVKGDHYINCWHFNLQLKLQYFLRLFFWDHLHFID